MPVQGNIEEAVSLEKANDVAVLDEVTTMHMTTMSPFMRPKRTPSMRERTPVIGKQRSPFREGGSQGGYGATSHSEMQPLAKKTTSFA